MYIWIWTKVKNFPFSSFLSEFVFFLFFEEDANIVLLRIFTFTAQLPRNMAFVAFSDICNHNAFCRKCIPFCKNIIRKCFQIFTSKMLSTKYVFIFAVTYILLGCWRLDLSNAIQLKLLCPRYKTELSQNKDSENFFSISLGQIPN